ncbi:unnamed protein product [Amoebophrya sp. A120]|nr:unnamed protein product [Amoebophrya sp. A120]|eukprot:GSA120T00010498001.1
MSRLRGHACPHVRLEILDFLVDFGRSVAVAAGRSASMLAGANRGDIIEDGRIFLSAPTTKKIAVITLAKEPVNLLDDSLWQQLHTAFQAVLDEQEKSKNIVACFLRSGLKSKKTFTAGGDLKEMAAQIASKDFQKCRESQNILSRTLQLIYTFPILTIALINGFCPGAGTVLILSCDIRIMTAKHAAVGLPEIAVGLPVPCAWGELLEQRLADKTVAKEMLLSGKMVTGAEIIGDREAGRSYDGLVQLVLDEEEDRLGSSTIKGQGDAGTNGMDHAAERVRNVSQAIDALMRSPGSASAARSTSVPSPFFADFIALMHKNNSTKSSASPENHPPQAFLNTQNRAWAQTKRHLCQPFLEKWQKEFETHVASNWKFLTQPETVEALQYYLSTLKRKDKLESGGHGASKSKL